MSDPSALPADVQWRLTPDGAELVHRDVVIARVVQSDGIYVARTRSYIDGYQQSRRLATLAGAQRYLEAWWSKWEPRIRLEVGNHRGRREPGYTHRPGEYPPDPEIKVRPRPLRRRR